MTLSEAVFTTVPQGRTFYYRVRRGDTLSSIARRHHVTTADIRAWNGLTQNKIMIGQQLRLNSEPAAPSSHHRGRVPAARQNTPPKSSAASRRVAPPRAARRHRTPGRPRPRRSPRR